MKRWLIALLLLAGLVAPASASPLDAQRKEALFSTALHATLKGTELTRGVRERFLVDRLELRYEYTLAQFGQFVQGAFNVTCTNLTTGLAAVPTHMYGLAKLNASYSGSAVKLFLGPTGASSLDIGFVNCSIDTAAAATFCTTTCKLGTFYDQQTGGTALDYTQATYSNMPTYTASCLTSQPCVAVAADGYMELASTSTMALTGDFSTLTAYNSNGGSDGPFIAKADQNSPFNGYAIGNQTQAAPQYNMGVYFDGGGGWHSCNIVTEDNNTHLMGGKRSGTTFTCQVDASTATITGVSNSTSSQKSTLFSVGGGSMRMTGKVPWILVWDGTAITTGDFTTIRTRCQATWGCQ